jgi:hypothetical protein
MTNKTKMHYDMDLENVPRISLDAVDTPHSSRLAGMIHDHELPVLINAADDAQDRLGRRAQEAADRKEDNKRTVLIGALAGLGAAAMIGGVNEVRNVNHIRGFDQPTPKIQKASMPANPGISRKGNIVTIHKG